jgi:hypothetical protein
MGSDPAACISRFMAFPVLTAVRHPAEAMIRQFFRSALVALHQ